MAQVAKGKFSHNLVTNLFAFATNFVVGLWFTPYLLHHLSKSTYGFIPLATIVTSYLGICTIAFNSSVGRYLAISFSRKDNDEANEVFNTAIIACMGMVGALLIPGILMSCFADYLVLVPEGREADVRLLFGFTVTVFLLTTLFAPFSSSAFTQNRLDISNVIKIIHAFVRVITVISLFTIFSPNLWQVGLALLAATIVECSFHVWSWRRLTPTLSFAPSKASRSMLGKLLHTGGWLAALQIGGILLLGVDLLLVNRLYGPESASDYALVMQWVAMIRVFAANVSTVFAPTIISLHGSGNQQALIDYSRRAVRLVGIIVALAAGLLCGCSQYLLKIWLGTDFERLTGLFILMIAPMAVNMSVLPMFSMTLAVNAVRVPGIMNSIAGVANVCLALLLWKFTNLGVYAIVIAGAITLTTKNIVFMPVYTARKIHAPPTLLIKETFYAGLTTLLVGTLAWGAANLFRPDSYPTLFLAMSVVGAVSSVAIYFTMLSAAERQMLSGFVSKFRPKAPVAGPVVSISEEPVTPERR